MNRLPRFAVFLLLSAAATLAAQQPVPQPTTAAEAPNRDTSYIDAQGTAHVTRVVPCRPLSASRRNWAGPRRAGPGSARNRWPSAAAGPTQYTARAAVAWSKLCPNQLVEDKIAGVPVRIVTPEGLPDANRDKVLLNLHGGGFNSDSGSYTESIPIAGYAKIKVVAVLYRLAPEHPFPAAVDDSVAVYKELLKTYKPEHIVIYGTSAGAILTAEVAAKLKQLGAAAAGGAGHLQRHGRLCARRGLDVLVWTARPLRTSRPAGTRPARSVLCGQDRPQRPGALAHLRLTCMACRPRCLSPAPATCCSAAR
jgi:monoterpene epsilon-lactone hydrolase